MFKNYITLCFIFLLGLAVNAQRGVGINTTNPKSTLDVNGSFGGRTTTVSANTALDTGHFIVICDNPSDITLTLPSAALSGGRIYFIKRINVGRVFINPNAGDSIDDTTAWVQLTRYQLTSVVGEGNTKWMVLTDGVPSTGGSPGTGLTTADKRNAGTNTPAVMLSNFTGAVLDSLKIDVDTATSAYPGLLTPQEKLLINSAADSTSILRQMINNHILADEDTDSTNELQQLSISNDTLYLSNGNMVYLGSISSDNDQDSTNELITNFSIVMDSISITEAGRTYTLAISDIVDTTSLSNRINTNLQANLDSAVALRSLIEMHILADEDLDSTNELQMLSISNDTLYLSDGNNVYLGAISSDNDQDSTNEYNTAFSMNAGGDSLIITDKGTRFAVSAGDIMDTTSLSNRINTNTQANIDSSGVLRAFITLREIAIRSALVDSAAAIRTTLDAHILADEDLDSTNELQMLSISNDTLYLSDGNNVYLGAITSDNDQDSTNEYNTSFTMNAGGDSLIITDKGTRFAVSAGDVIDTASLSNRININQQAIIDSTTNVRSNLADTAAILRTLVMLRETAIRSALTDSAAAIRTTLDAHILADEDKDSTNELQMLSISNDTLYLSDGNNVYLGAISSDNDQDSTNEYNTAFSMNAGGDSLIITDKGTRFAVSAGDIMDTTSLSNRINTNTQANIDSSGVLRAFITLREIAIRSALVDSAAAIRTTLDAHILADEDLDSTNELQMLSISNDTLYLSDGNNVYLGAITSDNDQDSTNEYNTSFTMNAGGDSLIITDKGTRFAVSAGDVIDTASLSNRININQQAIIDSTTNVRSNLADTAAILRTLVMLRETAIRSALTDSAAAIRTTLDAHILADEDKDSTNELQMLSISNDTLYLSDGNNVYLGAISSDNDQDSTNEYNTAFSMNAGGDSLIITDKGTRFAVSAGDIMDTTSLSDRINTNTQANIDSSNVLRSFMVLREAAIRSALVDTAAAIRTTLDAHILADEDLDSTNELQMLSISNDTLYLSDGNNVYLGAISSDNDQDSTNEYNTAFEMNAGGDSLIITDAGTRFAVSAGDIMDTSSLSNRINTNTQANIDSSNVLRSFIVLREAAIRSALVDTASAIRTTLDAHILADEDLDSTNELQMLSISNDTLYLSNGNDVYLGAISSDNDQDSTNEYNTAFEMNAGGDSLIIMDKGTRFAVSTGDIMDTTSLSNRINVNMQAVIDSAGRLNTALLDTAAALRTAIDAHIVLDEDTDSTNEYNTAFLVANDSLIIVDNGDSLKVSTKAIGPTGTTGSVFFVDTDGTPTEDNGQLFWDATNNRLGIGTDNPSHKLQVVGQVRATNSANADGTAGSPAYRFHDDANTGMFSPAADQLAFTTGGTEALRIDASQNVGIGDNISPTEKLDVDGTARLRNVAATVMEDTVLVIDNMGVIKKTAISDMGIIDSLVYSMDSLRLYASSGEYVTFIPDTDSTNELIDTVYTQGDSIVIVEGMDTFYVDYNDKDWRLNGTGATAGLEGIPGGSTASGDYSIAAGLGNSATGAHSSAVGGASNLASGLNSTASGGSSNTVSGTSSMNAGGFNNTVPGFYSGNIGGTGNTVSGDKAAVIGGENNTAPSYGETVVGINATTYTAADAIAYDSTDKVFVVGNGGSTSARSNAMTILKDGRVGIGVDGNANQTATLHIKPSTALDPLRIEDLKDSTSTANKLLVADSMTGVVYQTNLGDAVHNMAEIFDTTGGQSINTAGSYLQLAETDILDSYYTNTDSTITVTQSGRYKITYRVTVGMASTNNRSTAEHSLQKNGVDIPGSFSGTYHRNNGSSVTTGTVVKVVNLTANDVISIFSLQATGTGTLETVKNGSSLIIEFIKP